MLAPGKILKAEKWWDDKATPVLGLAYYLLASGTQIVPADRALIAMLAFVTAFIGVAGFGHVMNDLGDIELDRAAGKLNTMQGRKRLHVAFMIVALLAMAGLPWLLLPVNGWNLSYLGAQLLLLTLYVVPPVRLKVRTYSGVLTDALYAYTIPMLITWTTWSQPEGLVKTQPFLLWALVLWSLCPGIRGILVHQATDAASDAAMGINTFATRFGQGRTFWLLSRIVVPAEAFSFVLITVAFSRELRFYPVAVASFFCWRFFQLTYLCEIQVAWPWRLSSEQAVRLYGFDFLGEFYTAWFPVIMLAALCFRSPGNVVLAALHFAIFRTGAGHFVRYDLKSIPGGISRMRGRRV